MLLVKFLRALMGSCDAAALRGSGLARLAASLPAVPSLEDLRRPFEVRSDLVLARISRACKRELEISGATVACDRWFERESVEIDDSSIFFVASRPPPERIHGSSEDLVHCLVHPLVLTVLEELSTASVAEEDRFSLVGNANVGGQVVASVFKSGAKTSNDQGSSNVQGSSRIDVTATLTPTRGLVFFGELKAATESMEAAEKQLCDVERVVFSPAHYGSAPYLVVFACSGPTCQFYTLRRGNVLEKLWRRLDLVSVNDRVELVARVHFVFRLLRACAMRHFPTLPSPRSKAGTIELKDGFVSKRLSLHATARIYADGADVYGVGKTKEQWLRLYEDLSRSGPPELIKAEYIEVQAFVDARGRPSVRDAYLHVRPVGFLRPPRDDVEARSLFRDVLRALAWLHERRWVHRDVRMYNVLRLDQEDAGFVLIDCELCAVMDEGGCAAWPADTLLAPSHKVGLQPLLRDGRVAWTAGHDLQQLGFLLFDVLSGVAPTMDPALQALSSVHFSVEMLEFREALRGPCSATELLERYF